MALRPRPALLDHPLAGDHLVRLAELVVPRLQQEMLSLSQPVNARSRSGTPLLFSVPPVHAPPPLPLLCLCAATLPPTHTHPALFSRVAKDRCGAADGIGGGYLQAALALDASAGHGWPLGLPPPSGKRFHVKAGDKRLQVCRRELCVAAGYVLQRGLPLLYYLRECPAVFVRQSSTHLGFLTARYRSESTRTIIGGLSMLHRRGAGRFEDADRVDHLDLARFRARGR